MIQNNTIWTKSTAQEMAINKEAIKPHCVQACKGNAQVHSQLQPTYSTILFKSVHLCSNLYTPVQICTPLFKFVHPCSNLYTPVQICTPLVKSVHLCSNLYTSAQICTPLLKSVPPCSNLHTSVQICTPLCKLHT